MKWEIRNEPPAPKCGKPRGRSKTTLCELPPDHMVGRVFGDPMHWHDHFGRGPSGRWYSWAPDSPPEVQ